MLRKLTEIQGFKLEATDGDIGKVDDFLFDDDHWTVRYMVADTGGWLTGKKVLVSPISLGTPKWDEHHFPVRLTKEKIEKAPDLATDAPVSRKYEAEWSAYHSWPFYWSGVAQFTGPWAGNLKPVDLFQENVDEYANPEMGENENELLRSIKEVDGYDVVAKGERCGQVDEFIVDDESWMIRYVVVDTRRWLPGRKVLIGPDWVRDVIWAQKEVAMELDKHQIEESPEYDPNTMIERDYEKQLYRHYGKQGYWE